ncbi:hypothetical protein RND81_12G092300 [Saponaria officinalis]|uniref:Uncharacterized protein n=1 Tax=Saponaria officinalis TaxID=3572 RepID=A0AAW1H8D5_SAPOF
MACEKVQKGTLSSSFDKTLRQVQAGAEVLMTNQTGFVMTLDRSCNWSGKPAGNSGFPYNIGVNSSARFTHLRDGNFGSSGVVVYAGANVSMVSCAWVLAWDAPADSDDLPNKVYVACGPKGTIDGLTFDQIRTNLEYSGAASQAINPATQINANAEINDMTAGTASVGANFGLFN